MMLAQCEGAGQEQRAAPQGATSTHKGCREHTGFAEGDLGHKEHTPGL